MPKLKSIRSENYVPRNVIPRKAKDKALLISENIVGKEVIQAKRNSFRKPKHEVRSKRRQKNVKNSGVKHNEDNDTSGIHGTEGEEKHEACVLESTNDTNYATENLEPTYRKTGLSHFMDLEERKDLLCTPADDPLGLSGPDGYDALQWVNIKQEVPDDAEVCKVTFTEIPLKIEEISDHSKVPLPRPKSPVQCDDKNCDIEEKKSDDQSQTSEDSEDNDPWKDESSESEEDNISDLNDDKQEVKVRRKSPPHDCDICGKRLCSKGSLRLHKMKKHDIKMKFTCELCSQQFDLQREVVRHRNEIHRQEDGRFVCDQCGRKNADYHNFLTHLRTHYTGVSNGECGKDEDVQAVCKECGKMFKRQEGLKMHLALIHNADGGVMREKLKQQGKNFICDTCGKRFAFGCLLRDHINLHTGLKPYLCQECGRAFSQKASLNQHARTHNSVRPYKCTDCTQGFFGKGDLKKHMRKHTGERPYVCEICGEGFSQSSHLGVHRRSHTGERPFHCDLCGRGFTKRGDVVRHRRIHTGELPYLCQVCGKAFRQSTQCSNHIKNHHPDAQVSVTKQISVPLQQWTFT